MDAFEYKPAEYYTQYFETHPDFKVLKPFQLSEDKDEKNLYVGTIEVPNTIHPLELRVEIPVSFPHNKLTFRTKSLSGYPHLIHTGKTQNGDWFCLNTPFAETAEEQLKQEILRLKEWIGRHMSEDLPTIIEDDNVKEALFRASISGTINPDEIKEVQEKAELTLIDEFAENTSCFSENMGKFHCLQTPDKRFYAFKEKYPFTSFELPYIIEDAPTNFDILDDFLSLRNHYHWDEEICNHLLPGYKISKPLYSDHFLKAELNLDKETALKQIGLIREELAKEESFLKLSRWAQARIQRVPPQHKDLILHELQIIEEKARKGNGLQTPRDTSYLSFDELSDEEEIEELILNNWIERGQYIFNYFALGLRFETDILWLLLFTNNYVSKSEGKTYDIGPGEVTIKKPTSQQLFRSVAQTIDESMFFGRGALCDNIRAKRVALIGLGAIGSMVAEALAHAGIQKIGLWDSDVVEPGNICRSTYSLPDLGESKVQAIAKKLTAINPFIKADQIKASGKWVEYQGPNFVRYQNGSFYDNINYSSQEQAVKQINDYDLIIDCTGRNEILHFVSYALGDKDIVSLAITNKAKELLCITNKNGNPFELRKIYLSAIAQDTKDYYVEGSGCYEPTFKATYFDICALVNLCIKELNSNMEHGELMNSTIFKYSSRGIVADKLRTYKLQEADITLSIPNEVLLDALDLPESFSDYLGFIFGGYSKDGQQIMITNIVAPEKAEEILKNAFRTSHGIIDYLGDVAYSGPERDFINEGSYEDIAAKAEDIEINTNNPILAIRNPEGDFSFFLYLNQRLVPFHTIGE